MPRNTLATKALLGTLVSVGLWFGLEAVVTHLYAPELEAWDSPPLSAQEGAPNMPGNPYLLWEIAPGQRQEQGVVVHINAMGLRGSDIEHPKPAGVKRLLTTGDSSVFGFGVADDAVFSTVAASALGENVEAICAAIPGYSTYQSINLLRIRALDTEPDLVVIGNIWSDNNFDSFVDRDLLATYAGHAGSVQDRLRDLLSFSAVYRVADWKLRVKKVLPGARKVGWMLGSGEQVGLRRVAINDYARNLDTLVSMARARDADVVFLLLPNNEDVAASGGPNTSSDQRKAWDPYRLVMRNAAERAGAPLIDGVELFVGSGVPSGELFLDEMHPTAAGHNILGDALAKLLSDAGWSEGGQLMTETSGAKRPEYTDPFVRGANAAGAQAAPAGNGAIDGSAARIEGILQYSAYETGWLQIDVIGSSDDANPNVIASVKLEGPGPFGVNLGAARSVALRAYSDPEGDGPDADDPLFDMTGQIIDVDQVDADDLKHILVDLDHQKVLPGKAP